MGRTFASGDVLPILPAEGAASRRESTQHNGAVEIRPVAYDHPDAQALTERVQAIYTERYGSPDDDPADPATFSPPRGAFFVGYADGRPVAMGGWRRTEADRFGAVPTAEIKRMYVVEEATRQGLARRMLAHLEASAQAAGVQALVLSTGALQPEAIALYTSSGYEPIDGFGHYADSDLVRCFGKRLSL